MEVMGDQVNEAEARAACERILRSAAFAKARLMGRLLRHLVEQAVSGNARGATEYAIGLEVLGRKPSDYSPGEDSAVRVQVGRLRRRLETYHASCTQPGEVVIRIPLGGYMPVIERSRPRSAAPAPSPMPGDTLAIQPIQIIAGTAQAMALGLKTGVDKDLLIKAVATGSGGSTAFAIRAPWMAERRFMPSQGSAAGLAHYLDTAKDMAVEAGIATDLIDCLIDIYARAVPNIGERDVAAIVEHFETTRAN